MGLGGYPVVGLADARELAAEARRLVRQGGDPIAVREASAREAAEKARRFVTFGELARLYIEAHRAGWKSAKHTQQWENTLTQYAFPVIEKLQPSEITTEHVLKILLPIWASKTITASRVRNRIELVWDSAKARGLVSGENPARWRGHLDSLLAQPSKIKAVKHHCAMPYQQAAAFMEQLTQLGSLQAKALQFIILTACRSGEAMEARWDEIDMERREWLIPAGRMKSAREHRVPLNKQAIELLSGMPRLMGSPYVFFGQRQGRPLSVLLLNKILKQHKPETYTIHGFRSTFRDWAAERTNYPREVCELCLAHTVAQGAEAAYWRGDMLEKRRGLMELWGQYLAEAGTGAVIKIA